MWLSVRLLTSDGIAVATMTLGLYGVLAARRSAWLWFTASGLAKDVFLLTPAGFQLNRHSKRWSLVLLPAFALAVWALYLTTAMGAGFSGRGNLAWPFQGLAGATANWPRMNGADLFYLVFALGSVALGVGYGLIRKGWLRWTILLWSALAVFSSDWIWDFGNNAARAFGPIVVLVAVDWMASEGRTGPGFSSSLRRTNV
jgi:hypothetical protein